MTTYTVKPGESIQSAVNKAAPGDEIFVMPGTYREALSIDKSNITIRAAEQHKAHIDGGYDHTLFDAPGYVGFDNKPVPKGKLPSPVAANINKGKWKANGTGSYAPLVRINGENVIFEGFVVRNSYGRGIQVSGNNTQVLYCHADFTYAGGTWCGKTGTAKATRAENVVFRGCIATRGSLRAHDPTRGYGGTPMGVDVCFLFKDATNPQAIDCTIAYNYGEGIALGRGTVGGKLIGCTSFNNLHSDIYGSGGLTGGEIRDCVTFLCANQIEIIEITGLNMFDNVVFGDEEPDKQSGKGLIVRNNIFIGGLGMATFQIGGWNGKGTFPRPYVLWGDADNPAVIENNTIISGPHVVRPASFGSSTHRQHKDASIRDNIILRHPQTDSPISAMTHGQGYKNVTVEHNLTNDAWPGALTNDPSNVAIAAPILTNPFAVITGSFDLYSGELPDVTAHTFDRANYAPVADGPAVGMASGGGTVGAFVEPPTEPEPPVEPPTDPDPPVDPPDEPDPPTEPDPPVDPGGPDWREGLEPRERDLLVSAAAYAAGPRGGFPGEGLILLLDKLAVLLDEA